MPLLPQENRFHTYTYWILIAAGIYTLLPYLILSFYSHPQADDFSFAVRDQEFSYLTVLQDYYTNWTGRYFSTITLFRINPMISGSLVLYKIYPLVLLLSFCAALYYAIDTITNKAFNKKQLLALASILFTLYLLQLPSPSEGFYFFSTYATYQLPNILMLVLLAVLYKFLQAKSRLSKVGYTGLVSILCAAMIGSNEMALVVTFTTVLLITIANLKNAEARSYLLFLLLVCVICCLVAVLAPGNFNRMSSHPNAGKLLWSVVYAAFMTVLSFYRWLLPILAASVVYILYFGLPLAEKLKYSRAFRIDIRLAIVYFLTTIFLMNFVFAWSTGERATPRLENVIYFFFLFGWFYLLQLTIQKYKQALTLEQKPPLAIPAFVLLIFILSILSVENNISTAYIDLISGKAAAYNKALIQRYTQLKKSDCKVCTVDPLPAIPKTIYFADIISQAEQNKAASDMMWVNKGLAAYWGKSIIYLSKPNPPIQDNLTSLRNAGKSTLREKSVIK
ncbi:hypothetical protein H8S95_06985 [Pontibacter sp. KCTC 32443]|uniref:DUF6056 family protein n=1 Tax=Pontibacter TaxID=323449 RepID=UPI00164D3BC9|nr:MULTISPECIES: DUF6056 family protein [Pontibacter]MBC5773802.1 hypothetical protein [Pontibacter sp. KCTC 32443]